MNSNRPLKILVSIPTINRPERLKLEGILAYAHEKRGDKWQVKLDINTFIHHRQRPIPKDTDGIIAYVESEDQRQKLVNSGIPTVLLEDMLDPKAFPLSARVVTLLCDHEAEGRAAAEYFLSRHFQHFAWLGPKSETEWSTSRRNGYVARLQKEGLSCTTFTGSDEAIPDLLRTLKRPCALFAVHDFRARQALDAAEDIGISVPSDLAILGVDDDTILCETASPAISSLATGDMRLGYAAGRILSQLISRSAKGGRVIRFASHHVVTRRSTDADAIPDLLVSDALRYARSHLNGKLDATRLARQFNYSGHMLQLRAEKALGHSLGIEIRQMRLSAAEDLVSETDLPIADIAEQCGFTSVSHLSLRFKEAYGKTPLVWRKFTSSSN